MVPTLQIGDHLLVNKFLLGTPVDIPFTNIHLFRMPGLRKPQRGDIVVFKYPEDPTRDFIKISRSVSAFSIIPILIRYFQTLQKDITLLSKDLG